MASPSALPSHVHIFDLPNVSAAALPAKCGCTEGQPGSAPCSKGATYALPGAATFADGFHVAALNWTDAGVDVLLDGALVSAPPRPRPPGRCVPTLAVRADRSDPPPHTYT